MDQEDTDYEIVVINDGSTDKTARIMQTYQSNEKIIYYDQKNKGVSAARNMGIEISNGDWILFCDVDDEVRTGYIADVLSQIQENPECDMFCYARYRVETADYGHNIINMRNEETLRGIITIRQKQKERRKISIIEKLPTVYILLGDLKGKSGKKHEDIVSE